MDHLRGSPVVSFLPDSRALQLPGAFVQNEYWIAPERLKLTAGAKLEHNDYTGWEFQPSGRLAWMTTERQTFWGAISRAVRMPSRADVDMRFQQEPVNTGFPSPFNKAVPEIVGNDSFRSEELTAYELGWRAQLHPRFTVDVATFYNMYDHIRSAETGAGWPLVPVILENNLHGETYGVENVLRWQACEWCRLEAQYSFLKTHIVRDGGTDGNREMNSPHHQASVRSVVTLPGRWELAVQVRYQDGVDIYSIPGFLVCDARLAWQATKKLEFSVVGQNLGNDHHAEFPSLFTVRNTEVEQSVYGKVVWKY
jgi:iron complex outermembrane receptor protein